MLVSIQNRLKHESYQGRLEALKLSIEAKHQLRELLDACTRISSLESQRETNYPAERTRKQLILTNIIVGGLVANVFIAVLLAHYFSQSITTRLSRINNNAIKLASGDALEAPVPGTDEIANLDNVLHSVAVTLAEASRRERAIVENVQDAIFTIDERLAVAKANPAAANLLQYDGAALLGRRLVNLIDEQDQSIFLQTFDRAKTSQQSINLDARIIAKDGNAVWMLWSIYWSPSEKSYFCVAHDLNERKILEQLKRDFTNMVSHDLRTPLTAVQAFLQNLTGGVYGEVTGKAQTAAGRLERSVQRLVGLVNELLEIERLSEGCIDLKLHDAAVSDIVQSAIEMIENFARQHDVSLSSAVPPDLMLYADSGRIIQILQNLLSNAIKFSPAHSSVEIRAESQANAVEISVTDYGPGINDEDQLVVFDRFHQLKNSSSTKVAGSGLGLAICKAIVEQHHGTIGVRSKLGEGSTFWISLPLRHIEDNRNGVKDGVKGATISSSASSTGEK